ncbi:MAG: DUF4170 domain-containing protein [Rhodospirillales bacterium]
MQATQTIMTARDAKLFWVVGGEYRDTSFRDLSGQPEVFGPFQEYDDAMRVWRERTGASKSAALVRYTIAAG